MVSLIPQGIRNFVSSTPRLARGPYQATTIAVCAQKGGVGKTTTAVNLAVGISMYHNKRVLLIDLDSQGHVESSLSAIITSRSPETLSDILLARKRDLYEIIQRTQLEGFFVTPSDKILNQTEAIVSTKIGREAILRNSMKVAKTHFDYIIIDCAPNLGVLTLNALTSSDYAIIPSDLSILSLEGVSDIFNTIDMLNETLDHDLRVLGMVLTRIDGRNIKVNEAIYNTIKCRYQSLLFDAKINVNTDIVKAQLKGQPVYHTDENCRGSQQYRELVTEVLGRV